MSTIPKGSTLRLVMPKDSASKILGTLGQSTKLESREVVLTAGRLTTDKIFTNIKDFTRVRDELFHTMRQLGLSREPRIAKVDVRDFTNTLVEARKELDEKKMRYQELRSRIDSLEKGIGEAKNQSSKISEIIQAGFASADVTAAQGGFSRLLGRIPVRKLADAQRSIQNLLKDQVVMAPGNKSKDWVYILVATPEDKTSQVLQTLLLYDFVQTDIPKSEEPDLKTSKGTLESKVKELLQGLDEAKEEMKSFQKEAGDTLNLLADKIQDSLLLLQAVLKMGEGSNVSQAFAWLQKTPNPKLLTSLSNQGTIFEIE